MRNQSKTWNKISVDIEKVKKKLPLTCCGEDVVLQIGDNESDVKAVAAQIISSSLVIGGSLLEDSRKLSPL